MEYEVVMTKKEVRRHSIITKLINNKINGSQAARLLNLSVRQTKRIKAKVKKHGIKGIVHKLRGADGNHKL